MKIWFKNFFEFIQDELTIALRTATLCIVCIIAIFWVLKTVNFLI